MKEIEYFTNRTFEGKYNGKVRIIVYKGEKVANIEYICPNCGFQSSKQQEWKKPLTIICDNCKYKIKITSLRREIKSK
ncbi:MAG: hypothetical protein QXQ14_03315 [Candidatus Aenigmatarchaeota archaeon]